MLAPAKVLRDEILAGDGEDFTGRGSRPRADVGQNSSTGESPLDRAAPSAAYC
jgi:hypothetical protein